MGKGPEHAQSTLSFVSKSIVRQNDISSGLSQALTNPWLPMRTSLILRNAKQHAKKGTGIPYEVWPLIGVGVAVTIFAGYRLSLNFLAPSTRKGRQGLDTSRRPEVGGHH